MDFAAAAAYLESLDRVGTPQHTQAYHFERGIDRARHLLERLGGAPRATARCAIVTGSKGKGSTVAMIAAMLATAGHRVGAFTGPHLRTPTERFAIHDGAPPRTSGEAGLSPMAPARFAAYAAAIRAAVSDWDRDDLGPPTRFEAYTAMAYRWFEQQAADIALMEVGIGGRLDAVNLAEPMVSVFTNISLEHTRMLGNSVAEIAREKAGIMRRGGHAVFARQVDEVGRALERCAREAGSSCEFAADRWRCAPAGHDISPERSGQWLRVEGEGWAELRGDGGPLFVPLLGLYQLQNAEAALATVDALRRRGYACDARAMRAGLARARWQGRFDVLGFDPVFITDGAHTPYSMEQLTQSLRGYFPGRRIHFVLGVLRDKDVGGIVGAALRVAASITFTRPDHRRATPPEQLLGLALASGPPRDVALRVVSSVPHAVRVALASARREDVVCATGSLHVVAEAAPPVVE